jgi:hypothetical protein
MQSYNPLLQLLIVSNMMQCLIHIIFVLFLIIYLLIQHLSQIVHLLCQPFLPHPQIIHYQCQVLIHSVKVL